MKLTAIGSGYFRVFKDGIEVSKHTSEREAIEAAVNLEDAAPTASVTYKHDYEVKVESEVTTAPVPPTTSTPVVPSAGQFYAPGSFWYEDIQQKPIHAMSSAWVAKLKWAKVTANGAGINIYDDGKPIYFADANTPKVKVKLVGAWSAGNRNDLILQQGVRVPNGARPSGGTDHHLCVRDTVDDIEYNFHGCSFDWTTGVLTATDAGILYGASKSDGTMEKRNDGWNSATAGFIPLAGGVFRVDKDGKILKPGTCIAMALNGYATLKGSPLWPCKASDGASTDADAVPEGARFRFKKNIVIDPAWAPITKLLVEEIRDHGLLVMDKTGSAFTFFIEDPTQYGFTSDKAIKEPWMDWAQPAFLVPYLGGKMPYKIFGDANNTGEFPLDQLEAVA